MKTSEFVDILNQHKDIQKVVLDSKVDSAKEFWLSVVSDVYKSIPSDENNTDKKIANALMKFEDSDSLELVNKSGRLLKRFAKYYKESTGEKLSDKLAGVIGDKLQYYISKQAREFYIDFIDEINWSDGQFGKSGSCWWGTYKESQPAFIDAGGWGIRFYDNEQDTYGIGRTWILPKDGMLMCFNSYGIERPNVSKVIKQVFKSHDIILHYKAVELYNSNHDEIPYINSGTGFILYPDGIDTDTLDEKYDVDIHVEEDERECCYNCGDRIDEGDGFYAEDNIWCESCYSDRFSSCDRCGESYRDEDIHEVHGHSRYSCLCEDCLQNVDAICCEHCGEYVVDDYCLMEDTGEAYCNDCAKKYCFYCEECNEWNTEEHDHEEEDEEESDITPETKGELS